MGDLKSNYGMYVGLDVHKETIQVAVIDETGKLQFNTKIKHTNQAIGQITAKLPKDNSFGFYNGNNVIGSNIKK